MGRSSFQRVYIAFAGNSDICLSFLRNCADYGEKVSDCFLPSTGSPTSSRLGHRFEASVDSAKSLEALDVGDVHQGALLCRCHPTHGPSAGTRPTHHASPDPNFQSFAVSHTTGRDPSKLDIMTTPPAGEPQRLRSTVSLGGGSGVSSLCAVFQSSEGVYITPVEDKQRFLGQPISPRCSSRSLLQLLWLALKYKVLVSSKRSPALRLST
jgi:hypothetical protein